MNKMNRDGYSEKDEATTVTTMTTKSKKKLKLDKC